MVSFIYPFMISLAAALVVRDQAPKPLSFTLHKLNDKEEVIPNPTDRSAPNPQDVKLYAGKVSYQIGLDVINKDQNVQVVLDTGSSDLWVDASKLLDTNGFTKINQPFAIAYGDKSQVRGDFGTSLVWLENGAEVKDLQWALATDVELTGGLLNGILGIGRLNNEAGYVRTHKTYPNFTQKLKDQGTISSNLYSYYLNKLNTETGTITFGGRDLAKVKGSVATLPLLTQSYDDSRFDTVHVSKFAANDGSSVDGVDIVLDTGTTLAYLPPSVVRAFKVPGISYSHDGTGWVDCNQPSDKHVSWWFNDVEIKIPYKDLAVPAYTIDDEPTGRCFFAFQQSGGEGPYIVGDSFLRSAYITVNHDTNKVQISNVNYTDQENLVTV